MLVSLMKDCKGFLLLPSPCLRVRWPSGEMEAVPQYVLNSDRPMPEKVKLQLAYPPCYSLLAVRCGHSSPSLLS